MSGKRTSLNCFFFNKWQQKLVYEIKSNDFNDNSDKRQGARCTMYIDTKLKVVGKVLEAIPPSLSYASLYLDSLVARSGSMRHFFHIYLSIYLFPYFLNERIRDLLWLLSIDSM